MSQPDIDPLDRRRAREEEEARTRTRTADTRSRRRPSYSLPCFSANIGRRAFGILLLLLIVFFWTASSFLVSAIYYKRNATYFKPYFVTYINTSSFTLYLIPFVARKLFAKSKPSFKYATVRGDDDDDDDGGGIPLQGSSSLNDELTTKETLFLARDFCILWFIANYLGSVCLHWVGVGSSTVLSSLSSVFCFIIGHRYGVEMWNSYKAVAIALSFAGVVIVSSLDMREGSGSKNGGDAHGLGETESYNMLEILFGDLLALLGALFYGFYSVLLKVKVGSKGLNMLLFFGFVGILNMFIFLPGLVFFHASGIEKFQLPPSNRILTVVLINMGITFFSEVLWSAAVLYTTPVTVTTSLSLSIPLSLLGQIIVDGSVPVFAYWIGAGLVFAGFLIVNLERPDDEEISSDRPYEALGAGDSTRAAS